MCPLLLAMHFKMWIGFSGVSSLFLNRKEGEMEPLWSLSVSLSLTLYLCLSLSLSCVYEHMCMHTCVCIGMGVCTDACRYTCTVCVCVCVYVKSDVNSKCLLQRFSPYFLRLFLEFTSNEQSVSCKSLLSLTSSAGITDTCVCVQLLLEPRSPHWDHRHDSV